MAETCDVLILGAGLSGVGTACHLISSFPQLDVQIVDRRQAMGGTWDLFRYPGIRSDSDMFTFGFQFRPWNEVKTLADGPSIKAYIEDTARAHGIDKRISFGLRAVSAAWSSADNRWTVELMDEATGAKSRRQAKFLVNCTGYYNYDQGHQPDFPGLESYKGQFIHPQKWPDTLDYHGKRVVVIGSGATAVTIVPSMADQAAHITMLQRSPTYMMSMPGVDRLTAALCRIMPERWAYRFARARNIALQRWIFGFARKHPQTARSILLSGVEKQVKGSTDMRHFTPRYFPWEERLCAVQDGDLFKGLRAGKISIETDTIERFTDKGIVLASGKELEADIVVCATGLNLQSFGGTQLSVDGKAVDVAQLMTYKAVLLQDVPNFAWIFGYVNASWTLKVDIAAAYICRLLREMQRNGTIRVTPRAPAGMLTDERIMDALQAGYVRRARDSMPRQGREFPWRVLHDYPRDRKLLLEGPILDEALEFVAGAADQAPAPYPKQLAA
ncbi:MAG: NAD(P)/FAD-dependent oxidoreductase [Nevskia sp.]|nr:NAD(P)/FAD-dependent oxidoreductase [Nevskia sp.]